MPIPKAYKGLSCVLQYPSRMDAGSGKLLSGLAGQDVMTRLMPFTRETAEITTVQEVNYSQLVKRAKVVLLFGEHSLKLIGCKNKIDDVHGYTFFRDNVYFVPTYFPQDMRDMRDFESQHNEHAKEMQQIAATRADEDDTITTKGKGKTDRANYSFWVKQAISKAKRLYDHGATPNVCEYVIAPKVEQAIAFMDSLRDQYISFDIETNPLTQQITCFSLGNHERVYSIPIIDPTQQLYFGMRYTARIFRALALVFKYNRIIIHNAQFDLFILLHKYKIPPPPQGQIICTMNMHHRLYPLVEVSLGHCVGLYTDQPFHKNDGNFFYKSDAQLRQLLLYNAKDVETLHLVFRALCKEGKRLHALESFEEANLCQRPYLTLTYRGIRIDTEKLCARIDEHRRKADVLSSKVLPRLTGYSVNPNSPQQVGGYLYGCLGIKRPGKDPTNSKNLYKILSKRFIPAIPILLEIRRLSKEASNLQFKLWKENRVTCSNKIHGTDTFRLGSTALGRTKHKEFKQHEYGRNLQNWNKDTRVLAIPDPGYKFVQRDQAGAEALIVAYLTRHGAFRDLFLNGVKSHVYVAMHLFDRYWAKVLGVPNIDDYLHAKVADLVKMPLWSDLNKIIRDSDHNPPATRYYYHAKQTCHSGNYGVGCDEFIMNVLGKSNGAVRLSQLQGQYFLTTYLSLFPEIQEWWGDVREQINKTRVLYNLFGYPLRFTQFINQRTYKKAYASVAQSTVGCITHQALLYSQDKIEKGELEGVSVMQNNHDSLLYQCREDMVEECLRVSYDAFDIEFESPVDGAVFRMKSEAQIGDNWRDMKEV